MIRSIQPEISIGLFVPEVSGFEHIPADASRKMDDTLMEAIEPFHFRDAVPFQPAYLAGYLADRYDVSLDERMDRARERIRVCAERSFQATVTGYNGGKRVQDSDIEINQAGYWYALYPVWLLNTTWRKNQYIFAMNGQTGKMVGDPASGSVCLSGNPS